MIKNNFRRSILLSACLLTLAVPAVQSSAQTKTTTPATTPKPTGTVTPQGVTGTDPQPIKWPPSMKLGLGIA